LSCELKLAKLSTVDEETSKLFQTVAGRRQQHKPLPLTYKCGCWTTVNGLRGCWS